MKNLLSLAAALMLAIPSFAQLQWQPMGLNPSSVRWKSINSNAVRVIFQQGQEKEAFRIANIINHISDSAGGTVGLKRKHLNMVLQTNQVISNGYVGLAPYRSELFGTQPQNFNLLGSVAWLDLLAIHEYRHALQFINSRRGLTKFGYFLGGETWWAIMQAIAVPDWYGEGDAVMTETVLTDAGRGRTPSFFQEQRALLLNNRNYNYIKARNGSFKHMVPDHYQLGYAMLQHVRNTSGPDTWSTVLKQGSAYRGVFFPFSQALNSNTGSGTRKHYRDAYASLKTQWEEELAKIELTPTTPVTRQPDRTVTEYRWAHIQEDGSIICLRSSYKKTPEIIRLKDGQETRITPVGFMTEPFVSQNGNMLAWSEFTTDARWQNRNYNEVISYDLTTGIKKRITKKSKLFAPQFSSKGDRVVAVKSDEALKNTIVFIDPATGIETGSIPNPENDFLSFPKWTKEDDAIVFLSKRNSQIALLKYDFTSGTVTQLVPWSQHVIGGITIGRDVVYFCAGYSGINNIYAVGLNGGQVIKQITSVKIGADMPAVSGDEKTLVMSEFKYMGHEITQMDFDISAARVISFEEPAKMERYNVVTTDVEKNIFEKIPVQSFEVKNYSDPFRGTKLHTWGFSPTQATPRFTVRADNILNDFGADAMIGYNTNEKTAVTNVNVNYARYYLPINVHATASERAFILPTNLADTGNTSWFIADFNEISYGGGLLLPLTWYGGNYRTSLTLNGDLSRFFTNRYAYDEISFERAYSLSSLSGGLRFSNLKQRARQNVLPRWGQELNVFTARSIAGTPAEKYQAEATLYFPGIFRNHSLSFSGGYQQESLDNEYRYLDVFTHARGYTPLQGDREYVISGNYQLPLCYPDFGFAGLVYLQRIRTNVFYDYSQVIRKDIDKTFNQRSFGSEFFFDARYFNVISLSLGMRLSILQDRNYFNEKQKANFQLFFAGSF